MKVQHSFLKIKKTLQEQFLMGGFYSSIFFRVQKSFLKTDLKCNFFQIIEHYLKVKDFLLPFLPQ